ncbi:Arv1 domain-containing protein [Phanerochaete sordida]|uniref:Protein ARV n=1 Tax=Phanerochaete sordida TaxID=48140 RepID=A0A9P3L916_9APHY|nr:Arv1 domain-containing protein [Phanerochaete sordida]
MPICTNCAHPVPYLYTVYNSEDNLRLEQCGNCYAFADPYVEHDVLTLWIDLILLKRDVFRHLLFNRGASPRRLSNKSNEDSASTKHANNQESQREKARWLQVLRLGSLLIAIDAFIRWTHLNPSVAPEGRSGDPTDVDLARWNQDALLSYFRILVGCLIETVGFHAGVTLASVLTLHALDRLRSAQTAHTPSGLRAQFRASHVPLTILYSSLNKFFLLFLLTIWRPHAGADAGAAAARPVQYGAPAESALVRAALEMLDDDKLDRAWIVRNVLGGLATGFGLRVVLDCHPVFTTMIILAGWAVKTALAHLVSGWVGAGINVHAGSEGAERIAEEMWLAYSIP